MQWSNEASVLQLLKPVCLEPMHHNERNHHNKNSEHCNKGQPLLLQLEKARVQQGRPGTAKNK